MSNKGKGVKVSAAFSLMNLPHQPSYSNASAALCVINGNDGSLKTRVGRIQSGHTGGEMRNRKMILRTHMMTDARTRLMKMIIKWIPATVKVRVRVA